MKLEYRLKGLDCPSCAQALEEDLRKVRGVITAEVLAGVGLARLEAESEGVVPEVARIVRGHGLELDAWSPLSGGVVARENLVHFLRRVFIFGVGGLFLGVILLERLGIVEGLSTQVPPVILALFTIFVGYPVFRNAVLGVVRGRVNSDLLMTMAAGAAGVLGEWGAAFLIVCFVSVAHSLESYTLAKARGAIKELTHLMPERVRRVKASGESEWVQLEALRVGDRIQVLAGETIAADGKVVEGFSGVDESAVTGELLAVEKAPGDRVFAGSTNGNGALVIEVTAVGAESTVGRIWRLIREAESRKSPVQRFADRYSAIYLPIVIGVSVGTYLLMGEARNAIAVLVVACPCAIALATPVSVMAALANAARRGIWLKSGAALEALAMADTLVLDKTGTVTLGKPEVSEVVSADETLEEEWLGVAAGLESQSEHIIAGAVRRFARHRGIVAAPVYNVQSAPGRGISGLLNGERVHLGNLRMMTEVLGGSRDGGLVAKAQSLEAAGKTVFYCFTDARALGLIAISDRVRPEVPESLKEIRELGLRRVVLVTGDGRAAAESVARATGIAEVKSEQLPEDKVAVVKRLRREGARVVMIGDGINDAASLKEADVGIAIGNPDRVGLAMDVADIVLLSENWRNLAALVRLAKRTRSVIIGNIAFGIAFNIIGMTLAAVGILAPIGAAAAQALPDVVVLFNSSRLLKG